MFFAIWRRHELIDIASNQLGGGIAKKPFRRAIDRLNHPSFVDADDPVDRGIQQSLHSRFDRQLIKWSRRHGQSRPCRRRMTRIITPTPSFWLEPDPAPKCDTRLGHIPIEDAGAVCGSEAERAKQRAFRGHRCSKWLSARIADWTIAILRRMKIAELPAKEAPQAQEAAIAAAWTGFTR
jgi:hypothetical protein